MVVGRTGAADECRRLLPAHPPRRRDPSLDQIAECRLRRDIEPEIDTVDQSIDVRVFFQEVRLDLERTVVRRGLHPQIASTPGPHEGQQNAECVRGDGVLSSNVSSDKRNVQRQAHEVWSAERRAALPEEGTAGEIVVRRGQRMSGFEAEAMQENMVLKVLPHAREINDRLDVQFLEVVPWADAGQQEEARRMDRSRTEDHFPGYVQRM